jgi:hypothetical protein
MAQKLWSYKLNTCAIFEVAPLTWSFNVRVITYAQTYEKYLTLPYVPDVRNVLDVPPEGSQRP